MTRALPHFVGHRQFLFRGYPRWRGFLRPKRPVPFPCLRGHAALCRRRGGGSRYSTRSLRSRTRICTSSRRSRRSRSAALPQTDGYASALIQRDPGATDDEIARRTELLAQRRWLSSLGMRGSQVMPSPLPRVTGSPNAIAC